jgi:hypothetical protein
LDPDTEFRRLVVSAQLLVTRFESQLDEGAGGTLSVGRDELPVATAVERAHWAGALYESAVALLADARTALGSILILRGMLEGWAEFLYMASGESAEERRRRAIQIEIGAATQQLHTLTVPGILDPDDAARALAVVGASKRRLEELKRSEGWKAPLYKYGHAATWLERSGHDWPAPMYRGFSDAAHHQMPQWATLAEITWHHRAVRLEQCILIYGNSCSLALEVIGITDRTTFETAVRELHNDPYLKLALRGGFDQPST